MNKQNFITLTLIISGLALNPLMADSEYNRITHSQNINHSMPMSRSSLSAFEKLANSYPSIEGMFKSTDVRNFCQVIKGRNDPEHVKYMNILIKKAGITKEQWNKHYVHRITCFEYAPILYSTHYDWDDFMALVKFGVDLEHPVSDDDGNISTLIDYVRYKYRDKNIKGLAKMKYKKILKYLKKNKVKGCKELPKLRCTATYL